MSRSDKFWEFLENAFEILGGLFILMVILGFLGAMAGLIHYVLFWSVVGLTWAYFSGDMTLFTTRQDDDGSGALLATIISGAIAILVGFFVDSHLQFDNNDDHHEIKATFAFVGALTVGAVIIRIILV